jgi:general secretion pathway protein G
MTTQLRGLPAFPPSRLPSFPHSRIRRRAFTLIELLVVITILVVLASVVIPRVVGRSEDANQAKAIADVESLGVALDLYAADNGRYPSTEQGLAALREPPALPPEPRVWNGPYLKKHLPLDPWGRTYLYVSPGIQDPATYDLSSLGADGRVGGTGRDSDLRSWE